MNDQQEVEVKIDIKEAIPRFREGKCPWRLQPATKTELILVEALCAKDSRIEALEKAIAFEAKKCALFHIDRIAKLEKVVQVALIARKYICRIDSLSENIFKGLDEALAALGDEMV